MFLQYKRERTVDGNGHSLSQDIAIGAFKGWNSVKRIDLGVFWRSFDCLWSPLEVLNLEVKLVSLSYCYDCRRPGVALVVISSLDSTWRIMRR